MASPQTEDGYTRIANELLEAVLVAPFSKRQLLIVMAVIRQTYGYNRREDDISGSRLAGLTGIRRNHCTDTVAELETMCVLNRGRGRWGQRLSIQKNYDKWKAIKKTDPKTGSLRSCNRTNGHIPKQEQLSPETGPDTSRNRIESDPKTGHTKDSKYIFKDNLKDNYAQPDAVHDDIAPSLELSSGQSQTVSQKQMFETWWRIYPKKRSKGDALKAWHKIKPSEQLTARMIDSVELAKHCNDWIKNDGQFIPYPATWLRAQGWEDEMQVEVVSAPTGKFGATVNNLQELFGGAENVHRTDGLSLGGL